MKKGFENLDAWKLAREFRKNIYHVTKSFPKAELFGLTSQIRRAACSVTANIAEGVGRYSLQECIHFCIIARGSINEILDQLYVSLDENYISQSSFDTLYEEGRRVEQVINGYINHLRKMNSRDTIHEVRDT